MKPQRAPVNQIGEYALPHISGAHLRTPGKAPGWPLQTLTGMCTLQGKRGGSGNQSAKK